MPILNQRICSVEGCNHKHLAKSYCAAHYRRLWKTGSLRANIPLKLNFQHGHARRHYLYATWLNMRQRCNNPTNPDYKLYGAKGIKICKRWDNFALFISDMGKKPTPQHTIDRIDNDGDYTPTNCRWATVSEQNYNKRPSRAKNKILHKTIDNI